MTKPDADPDGAGDVTKSSAAWDEARRREAIVAPLMDGADKKARLLQAAKAHDVSPRTLFRWKQSYSDDGLPGLLPDTEARGGKGGHRLGPERETLLDEVLTRSHLQHPAPTQRALNAEVERAFREKGLKPPAFHTVRDRIKALMPADNANETVSESSAQPKASRDAPQETTWHPLGHTLTTVPTASPRERFDAWLAMAPPGIPSVLIAALRVAMDGRFEADGTKTS